MRTFIVIVVASLIPVGMWTAGCRQESRQAAFPNSSEIEALAKAPDSAASSDIPPVIHPAKIDKGILNLPETPTMARVNAVQDRSKQIAQSRAPDDLFTLPETTADDRYAMAASASVPYEAAPAPAAIAPIPSAREFWSRPVAPVAPAPSGRRSLTVPDDISAMAAPGSVSGGNAILPPAPYLAPIPSNAGGQFFPEEVPGIFMSEPLSERGGSPPAGRERYDGYAGGDARSAAPSSSQGGGLFTLNLDGLIGASPASESRAPAPMIDRSIVVRSIPGEYEPLPEPIPLAEYQAAQAREMGRSGFIDSVPASMPAAPPNPDAPVASAPVSVSFNALTLRPPVPPARKVEDAKAETAQAHAKIPAGAKTSAPELPQPPSLPREASLSVSSVFPSDKADGNAPSFFDAGDIKAALAPLPDIAGAVKASAKASEKKEDAAKEEREEKTDAFAERDVFRMDFWEKKPGGIAGGEKADFALVVPESEPTTKDRMPLWIDDIPEVREPARESVKETTKAKPESKTSAPQKIKLQPIRRADKELGRIDSANDAPPMRF